MKGRKTNGNGSSLKGKSRKMNGNGSSLKGRKRNEGMEAY